MSITNRAVFSVISEHDINRNIFSVIGSCLVSTASEEGFIQRHLSTSSVNRTVFSVIA